MIEIQEGVELEGFRASMEILFCQARTG